MFFFFNDTATTEIYTLSLHDALPISFLRLENAYLCFAARRPIHATCPGFRSAAHPQLADKDRDCRVAFAAERRVHRYPSEVPARQDAHLALRPTGPRGRQRFCQALHHRRPGTRLSPRRPGTLFSRGAQRGRLARRAWRLWARLAAAGLLR